MTTYQEEVPMHLKKNKLQRELRKLADEGNKIKRKQYMILMVILFVGVYGLGIMLGLMIFAGFSFGLKFFVVSCAALNICFSVKFLSLDTRKSWNVKKW